MTKSKGIIPKKTPEFKNTIIKEYLSGVSARELNKKYHTTSEKILKEAGVLLSASEFRAKYRRDCIKLNWQFEDITNETEAYILGFWLSDGCLCSKTQLSLAINDLDILTDIRNYFSPDITIGNHNRGAYCIRISSKIACKNAQKWGIIRRKTNTEFEIPPIPENLIQHFIRGYFDGDGTIFVCNPKNHCSYLKGNICSPTIKILESIQKHLENHNIFTTINCEHRKNIMLPNPTGECIGHFDMYRLFIRKKDEIYKFYKYIYEDATIYLKRKKSVFDNFYIHANIEVI